MNAIAKKETGIAKLADMQAMVEKAMAAQQAVDAAKPTYNPYWKLVPYAGFNEINKRKGETPFLICTSDDQTLAPLDAVWVIDSGTFRQGVAGYQEGKNRPDTFTAAWHEEPVNKSEVSARHPHVTKPYTEFTMLCIECDSDPSIIGTVVDLSDSRWSRGYNEIADALRGRMFEVNKALTVDKDQETAQELYNTRFPVVTFDAEVGLEMTDSEGKTQKYNRLVVEIDGWSGPVAVADEQEEPELDAEDDTSLEDAIAEEPETTTAPRQRQRVKKTDYNAAKAKPAKKVVSRRKTT